MHQIGVPPVSTSKWKLTCKTVSLSFQCPILSIVIFLEPRFFSLRSPPLLLKGLHWVQLLILPVHLHKPTKSSLDHLRSLSLPCWNSRREPLDWLLSPSLGSQKQSHTSATWFHLYQLFHSNPWGFRCAYRFLFWHLSGKQPSFLPWKDCHEPHSQPKCQAFSCGLSLISQVNPSSSGLSGDDQNPDVHDIPGVTFQSKSGFTNHH